MPLLHMDTEEVRHTAEQFYRLTAEIDDQVVRLRRSLGRLEGDWRSPSAARFISHMEGSLNRARALSGSGAELVRRLSDEVLDWEEADAHLEGGDYIHGPHHPFPIIIYRPLPYPYPYPYPPRFIIRWPGFGPQLPEVEGWGRGIVGPTLNDADIAELYGFPGGGGGGGGGGAWGVPFVGGGDDPLTDIPTDYHLIRGAQLEYFEGYRQGEMTWDEAMKSVKEMEASTRPDYFDGKATLYDFGRREGEAAVAWRQNQLSGQYGTIDAAVGTAVAQGDVSVRIGEHGAEANYAGTVGLYAIRGEGSGQIAGIDMAGQAYLGAEISGNVDSQISPLAGTVVVGAGVNAFAGARAEGSLGGQNVILDGVDVGAKGALLAGAGVTADGQLGVEGGIVKADLELGAALGIGAEVGFSVEIDIGEAARGIIQDAEGAGRGIADLGRKVISWY